MKLKFSIILLLVLLVSTTADAQKSKKSVVLKQPAAAQNDSPDASMKKFISAIQTASSKTGVDFCPSENGSDF